METDLSHDADKLLCVLYKSFLEKRKNGISKSNAKVFGSSHNIHKELLPSWIFEDVDDTCRELSRNGFLNCLWGDDIAFQVSLSDTAIVYMENRFKHGLSEVAKFVANFLPFIPS